MFGVVPKSLNKTNPADADNMIEMSSSMLVESVRQTHTGRYRNGDKQSEKFFKYYKRLNSDNLVKSINSAGFSIDDEPMFANSSSFHHCGGAVARFLQRSLRCLI